MPHILEVKNITKRFGGLTAVDDVGFYVDHGEVVALVGDNGAGKSTLIKVISGVYKPDAGEIFLNGSKIHIESPIDAINYGIETIYQDLALAENLDVPSNIFLGREITKKKLALFLLSIRNICLKSLAKCSIGLTLRFLRLNPIYATYLEVSDRPLRFLDRYTGMLKFLLWMNLRQRLVYLNRKST